MRRAYVRERQLGRWLQDAVGRHGATGTEGLRLLECSGSATLLTGGADGLLDVLGERFWRRSHAGIHN